MDTNRDSAHQSQNDDNFPTFSLGLEFLNEAEKEKNNGKGDSASAPSRFASLLSEGEMQQILSERHSGKTKQMTNWSVSTFKGKLKFFRFKIVKYVFTVVLGNSRTHGKIVCKSINIFNYIKLQM